MKFAENYFFKKQTRAFAAFFISLYLLYVSSKKILGMQEIVRIKKLLNKLIYDQILNGNLCKVTSVLSPRD